MSKEKISAAGLINKLAMAPDNCSMEFLLRTVPKMNKTGKNALGEKIPNPFLTSDVIKESLITGKIKFNYTSEVNKQRLNEGKDADFVGGKRPWGEKDGCFISHIGKDGRTEFYMDVMVEKSHKSVYFVNGVETKKEDLKPYFPAESPNRQGVDNQVFVRSVKLGNVKEAKIGEKEYIIG
jgi:hypothetical protein